MKKILMLYAGLTFLLNFTWEVWHGFAFYNLPQFSTETYLFLITYAAITDAVLLTGIYACCAWLIPPKEWRWHQKITLKKSVCFTLLTLSLAAFIEYKGVYLLREWSYNKHMPLFLGIGISPLLQLSITGWLAMGFLKVLPNLKRN